tara:strand:+ start:6390 stop:7271 length:882 start_codon:yes stop_codon:yes gene_type:complete
MRQRKSHLAGIVPVAGRTDKFELPWPDCMMPLSQDYVAIERSILECAYAGCKTIWVICNDDVSPIIKHRLGEYVYDPVWYDRKDTFARESRRIIPIFYVPIHSKDTNKRDCLSWSLVYGALTAFKIGSSLSQWVAPSRYYVAFPCGIYEPSVVRPHRAAITKGECFAVSYEGSNVLNNKYMGFTFGKDEWKSFRRVLRSGTGLWSSENLRQGKYPSEVLPIEERYSARHFTLDKVLESVKIVNEVELSAYHQIDTWDDYLKYLRSDTQLEKPKNFLTNGKKLNKICKPIEEDE